MIRPGKMRHTITLQRVSRAPNDYGTEVETWANLATLRAELVSREAAADPAGVPGTAGRVARTFRARIFGGVTVADRVMWQGHALTIKAVSGADFGEGRVMELQCEGPA